MLGYNSIENYYNTVFAMVQHHKWSIQDIDTLVPWEFDIYVMLLLKHLKEVSEAKERNK